MKVDAKETICGVRPAVLKRLLRKGYEQFDTPVAMNCLDLDEPEITASLRGLQQGGWIEFLGTCDGVDRWRPGSNGRRLLATTLLKRIPRAQGQQILERLIDETRAINEDARGSLRIERIMLFGSLLTGASEETVGDVDVVITIRRRNLPEEQLHVLQEKERASAPDSVRDRQFGLLDWPETRLHRRLRQISPYLSRHQEHDLLGCVHQEVYAYNLEQEREVAPDPEPRTRPGPRVSDVKSVANSPYSRAARDWPAARQRAMVKELDAGQARLAQHLWMNGEPVKAISERIGSSSESVGAYLASRAFLPREQRRESIRASLKATVLNVLPSTRDYSVLLQIHQHPAPDVTIDTEIIGPRRRRRAEIHRTGRGYFIRQSPPELVAILEAVDRTATTWYEAMRPKLRGLGVEISIACMPQEKPPGSAKSKLIDPRPLAKPLLDLLNRCWKKPRRPYEGYQQKINVTLEANPIVIYRSGLRDKPTFLEGTIPRAVIALASSIHKSFGDVLEEHTSFSVYVTGAPLESDVDALKIADEQPETSSLA